MAAVSTADIRAYIAQRQATTQLEEGNTVPGASNAEINRELAILKRMYALAVQAGKLLHRPHIPMLEERNVRSGFFELEQFEAVRAQLPDDLKHVATFAYLTGWRVPSEVLTLQWRQVDFKAGVVRLEPDTTKNDEGRTFPFDVLPELRQALEEQRRLAPQDAISPWVFHRGGESFLGADGAPTAFFGMRGAARARKPSVPSASRTISDGRRFAISCAPVYRRKSRCSSPVTRRDQCSIATTSSTKLTFAQRSGSWLRSRQGQKRDNRADRAELLD